MAKMETPPPPPPKPPSKTLPPPNLMEMGVSAWRASAFLAALVYAQAIYKSTSTETLKFPGGVFVGLLLAAMGGFARRLANEKASGSTVYMNVLVLNKKEVVKQMVLDGVKRNPWARERRGNRRCGSMRTPRRAPRSSPSLASRPIVSKMMT